jgi:hypothetical protein
MPVAGIGNTMIRIPPDRHRGALSMFFTCVLQLAGNFTLVVIGKLYDDHCNYYRYSE